MWRCAALLACASVAAALSHKPLNGGFDFAVRLIYDLSPAESTCFFEFVNADRDLMIMLQLVESAEQSVMLEVKSPSNSIDKRIRTSSETDERIATTEAGDYSFCLNNESRYRVVRASFTMLAYNTSRFADYSQDMAQDHEAYASILETVANVTTKTDDMNKAIGKRVIRVMRDFRLMRKNRSYIDRFSVLQCVIILVSSVTQTFYLRKLFVVPTKSRPHA